MALPPANNQSLLDRVSAEVAPETSPLLGFLLEHARTIAIAVAAVLVAALAYGLYTWHAKGQLDQANNELGRLILIQDAGDRLDALAGHREKAPKALQLSIDFAMAKAAIDSGRHEAAVQAWDRILASGDATLAFTAGMGKAQALALQDKNSEAIAVLQALTPPQNGGSFIRDKAIADIAEKMGDVERAAAAYEAMAAANPNPAEAEFLRQKAASLRETSQAS